MTRKDIDLLAEAYLTERPSVVGFIMMEETDDGGVRVGLSNDAGDMVGGISYAKPGESLSLQLYSTRVDLGLDENNIENNDSTLVVGPINPKTGGFMARIGSKLFRSGGRFGQYIHIKVSKTKDNRLVYSRA